MDARQSINDSEIEKGKWNLLLDSLSQSESEFLTQVRGIQQDDTIQNKLNKIEPLFNGELISILSGFIKAPPLNELKILKDRMQILKSIIMAGFFTSINKGLVLRASEQIKDAYIKALENKMEMLQFVTNDNKSKLNEKDRVIGWLQAVLDRYENPQNQSEISLSGNPSSMWQQAPIEVSQREAPSSGPRCNVRQ